MLSSIKCDTALHQALVVTSTVMIIVYLVFLGAEQILYTSNSLEPVVPWGSFERQLASVRVLIKIVISIGFAFDKAGNYRWQVNLACFAIQAYIVVRRNQNALIFCTSVYYTTIVYEAVSMWLYITVALHILSGTSFTICSMTLLIFSGLGLALILVIVQNWRK